MSVDYEAETKCPAGRDDPLRKTNRKLGSLKQEREAMGNKKGAQRGDDFPLYNVTRKVQENCAVGWL